MEKPTKEYRQCFGCGAILSKDFENSTDSFCPNVNCPFSGISCLDESWDISYGQKTIDRQREVIGKLVEAVKAQHQMRASPRPIKLDEALSWKENDVVADKLMDDAIAEAETVIKEGK